MDHEIYSKFGIEFKPVMIKKMALVRLMVQARPQWSSATIGLVNLSVCLFPNRMIVSTCNSEVEAFGLDDVPCQGKVGLPK